MNDQETQATIADLGDRVASLMGRPDRFFCRRRTTAGRASWDHGRSPSGRWRRWERQTSLPGSSADWSSWKVIGVDVAENMLREIAMEIQRRNFPQATVLQMDAEHLAFAPVFFDAVLCGFAVFLSPHCEQALSELLCVKEVP